MRGNKVFEYIKLSSTIIHEFNHAYFNNKDPYTTKIIDDRILKAIKTISPAELEKLAKECGI